MPQLPIIRIVAAVVLNQAGQMLMVRKRDTVMFMHPGGKFEEGETCEEAIVRELREELGFELGVNDFQYVGRFAADAANEPGHRVDCDVLLTVVDIEGAAAAEIEELLWVDPHDMDDIRVAPLTSSVLRAYVRTMSSAIQGRSDP